MATLKDRIEANPLHYLASVAITAGVFGASAVLGVMKVAQLEFIRTDRVQDLESRASAVNQHELAVASHNRATMERQAFEVEMREFVTNYADVNMVIVSGAGESAEILKRRAEAQVRLLKLIGMAKEQGLEKHYAQFFRRYGYDVLP
jgi:hypothetical protein